MSLPCSVTDTLASSSEKSLPVVVIIFITPVTASEPYIADEPWDTTSILSTRPRGTVPVFTKFEALL